MRARSLLRSGFWILLAILVLAHLLFGWLYSGRLIDEAFTPQLSAGSVSDSPVEVTPVTFSSTVGDLDAWFIPSSSSTWVIHVHGRDASPSEAGHLFAPLRDAGYPQLAITYRNDLGQPPDPTGLDQYGASEWEDVGAAVDYALANGAEDVVLSGFSEGASHILSFVYKNSRDAVSGLIFDAPNIDFGTTADYQAGQTDLPLLPMKVPGSIAQVAKFMTSLRIGVNWKSIDYVDKTGASLRVPVLVHHGTADPMVPIEESVSFADQSPELIRLVQVRDAGHLESFEREPEPYIASVLAFMEQVG